MSGDQKQTENRLSVRLDEEDRIAIDALVMDGEYENVSMFVRQAVKEKLNPRLRKARLKKELLDLLKDPAARRELGIAPDSK